VQINEFTLHVGLFYLGASTEFRVEFWSFYLRFWKLLNNKIISQSRAPQIPSTIPPNIDTFQSKLRKFQKFPVGKIPRGEPLGTKRNFSKKYQIYPRGVSNFLKVGVKRPQQNKVCCGFLEWLVPTQPNSSNPIFRPSRSSHAKT